MCSPRNCSILLTPKRQLGIDWGKEIGKGAPKGGKPWARVWKGNAGREAVEDIWAPEGFVSPRAVEVGE